MTSTIYESRAPVEMTAPDQIAYEPRRFSVEEYFRMAELGILGEEDDVELIEGTIVVREPPGPEHAGHVSKIASHFYRLVLERRAIIRTENPTLLDRYNAPQPDIAVVKWRDDYYRSAHPTPSDVLLAIEVAWTSASRDRRVKAPLYARTGIPEYWLLDLKNEWVEVYRDASDSGYASYIRQGAGSILRPLALDDVELRVEEVLLF